MSEEPLVLLRGAEAQDVFDAGAVVPGPVEQDGLAGRGEVGDVALEVPLALLAFGGLRQRDVLRDPRVQVFRDPLDHASLAGGVPSFEHHRDPRLGVEDPLLHLHELFLESGQLAFVGLVRDLLDHAQRVYSDGLCSRPATASCR